MRRRLSPVAILSHHLTFFFNETAPTEIYPLSLHAALPISPPRDRRGRVVRRAARVLSAVGAARARRARPQTAPDRKSTRLNSSHVRTSYAVFCLEKKQIRTQRLPAILRRQEYGT